jgi:hypothetical protein
VAMAVLSMFCMNNVVATTMATTRKLRCGSTAYCRAERLLNKGRTEDAGVVIGVCAFYAARLAQPVRSAVRSPADVQEGNAISCRRARQALFN